MGMLKVRQLPGMTEPMKQMTDYFLEENSLNFQGSKTKTHGVWQSHLY